jgi:energy-coupling factor transport system substrate-specific component
MKKAWDTRRTLDFVRLLAVFSMLGAIMFVSDILMEFLPNIHIVGVLTVVYTIVYRSKALIPIYVYVFVNGLYMGFGIWWLAYLYIWAILWALVMLVPRRLPETVKAVLYVICVTAHGLLFGVLYAPVQMIYNSDLNYIISWVSIGFVTADIYHGIGNCIFGILLIVPLSQLLLKLEAKTILLK